MNGVYYARYGRSGSPNDSGKVWATGHAVVPFWIFKKVLPDTAIVGEWGCECGNSGGGCSCIHSIGIDEVSGKLTAHHSTDRWTHQNIDQFSWNWSGYGVTEHWFDGEAVQLAVTSSYSSNSGLTADHTAIVAYNRHVEVKSGFTVVGGGKLEPGVVQAEFVNRKGGYRGNWTGHAIGARLDDNGQVVPIVGDNLDVIIETLLASNRSSKPVVCRHNARVRVQVVTDDPQKISRFLCTGCRLQGVRWEEFLGRDRKDICPYFRRAAKAVVEKSQPLPPWAVWQGDLLASYLRMEDGDWIAYEVVFVRRRDGFIRRAVWQGNSRLKRAWLFQYNGYIPNSQKEFALKYPEAAGKVLEVAFIEAADSQPASTDEVVEVEE